MQVWAKGINYMQFWDFSYRGPVMAALALLMAGSAPTVVQAQNKVYPAGLTNIAAAVNGGRIVSSTSAFGTDGKWSAQNLIDGEAYSPSRKTGSNGWASARFDPIKMESVTIGFAGDKIRRIGLIKINPGAATIPERWVKDVEAQVALDENGPYRTVSELAVRREAVDQSFVILPAQARFVRFRFRSNYGSDVNVAAGEIEIYEAIDTEDGNIGNIIGRLEQSISELKTIRDSLAQRTGSGPDSKSSPNVNIAAAANGGKILGFSSLYDKDNDYSPKNLIDGQNFNPYTGTGSNGWASDSFNPGDEFVTIGFRDERVRAINRVVVNPTSNQASLRWARRMEILVSSDSPVQGPWRLAATIELKTGRGEDRNQEFAIGPVEAKYVRFVFMANGPNDLDLPGVKPGVNSPRAVSLGEIELYEVSDSSSALNALISRYEGILKDLKRLNEDGVKPGKPVVNQKGATTTLKKSDMPDVVADETTEVM